jgi:hypothetical protein
MFLEIALSELMSWMLKWMLRWIVCMSRELVLRT